MSEIVLPTRVALVGNPNSGKTALFNALTGGRQKVANYPGVTVERKEGVVVTPAGLTVRLIDLPGTYSLRARSLDEIVTRDMVLGKLAGEDIPRLLVCVADSTNLRLALRLALELKRVGRPMILALNMFDIARHRGFEIDLDRLSAELGIPVVSSVAVRRGGTRDLLARIDEVISERGLPRGLAATEGTWSEPDATELRTAQRRADSILDAAVRMPSRPDGFTRRVDRVVLHPVFGLVILLAILFLMFQAVFAWAQAPMDLIKSGFDSLGAWAGIVLPQGWLLSFVRDGVISGLGSVLVFLPQILTLFLFILLLEDFGYMARAAFLMDRIMGGAGLHGRAFIPLLSSFACAIPGIMATRVIASRRSRLVTILVAPLMTCSARIPVYTLIIAAFVPARTVLGWFSLQGLVMFGLYAAGIAGALGMSWVFNRLLWRRDPSDPFMLELPDYKRPVLKNLALGLLQRGQIFLHRAGTTIFAMMVVIWFLCSVPPAPADATLPAINYSLAARIGQAMEPVLRPVGFNWQIDVALVPGMAAREVAVAALGTVYAIEGAGDNSDELGRTLTAHWSLATALALLAWYVFAPQCAATLGVVRRETNSWKWTLFLFSYMLALAYLAAFVTYQTAVWLGAG
jgi:ferrous iron transport protein B